MLFLTLLGFAFRVPLNQPAPSPVGLWGAHHKRLHRHRYKFAGISIRPDAGRPGKELTSVLGVTSKAQAQVRQL